MEQVQFAEKSEIRKIKRDIGTLRDSIESMKKTLSVSQATIDALGAIEETLNRVNDPESGIEATFGSLAKHLAHSSEAVSSIDQHNGDITKIKADIQDVHDKSLKQLGEISGAVLSRNFANRGYELEGKVEAWHRWLQISTLALTLIAVGAAIWHSLAAESFLTEGLAIKAAITAPILYYTFFCATQYGREKQLMEEYAFKGAVSLSLEAHRAIIHKDITDDMKNAYLTFLIKQVELLYTPPSETIKKFSHKVEHPRPSDLASAPTFSTSAEVKSS